VANAHKAVTEGSELRAHWPGGHLLAFLALQWAQVGYVRPARELGVVFGTIPGSALLKEGAAPRRLVCSTVIAPARSCSALSRFAAGVYREDDNLVVWERSTG
jgi:hypothetical protein